MRDFAKISCTIWGSQKFMSLGSDDARLLYFYLHTCPHVNSLGCFVLRTGYALADLGWDKSDSGSIAYRKAMQSLCDSGLIEFNMVESVVRIVDFLRHSPFTNIKHAKGAIKILHLIPDCQEKNRLISELRGMKHVTDDLFPAPPDTLSIGYRKPLDTPRPETRDQRPETILRDGGGGDRREVEIIPPSQSGKPTFREQMMDAMGADHSGVVNARTTALGGRADMELAEKWRAELGLTEEAILTVINETMARKRDGPPTTFRYFTPAMQREASRKNDPELTPANSNEAHHDRKHPRDRRDAAASDRLQRRLDAAARID